MLPAKNATAEQRNEICDKVSHQANKALISINRSLTTKHKHLQKKLEAFKNVMKAEVFEFSMPANYCPQDAKADVDKFGKYQNRIDELSREINEAYADSNTKIKAYSKLGAIACKGTSRTFNPAATPYLEKISDLQQDAQWYAMALEQKIMGLNDQISGIDKNTVCN